MIDQNRVHILLRLVRDAAADQRVTGHDDSPLLLFFVNRRVNAVKVCRRQRRAAYTNRRAADRPSVRWCFRVYFILNPIRPTTISYSVLIRTSMLYK